MTSHLLALIAALAALVAGRRRGWLSRRGTAAAAGVGAAVWAGTGPAGVGLLLFFFVSSSGLGRLRRHRAAGAGAAGPPGRGGEGGEAGRPRGARQVVANGGAAALCAAAGAVEPALPASAAVLGSLAAATADTWSSEVGRAVAGPTRLVTTGERVPPGASGGVSVAGTVAGLAGALAAGLAAAALGLRPGGRTWAGSALPALAAGVAGAGLDSLLGATLEQRAEWMDNDAVNLACTAAGAAVGAWMAGWAG